MDFLDHAERTKDEHVQNVQQTVEQCKDIIIVHIIEHTKMQKVIEQGMQKITEKEHA